MTKNTLTDEPELLLDPEFLPPEMLRELGSPIVASVNPLGRVEYLKAKVGEHKLAAAAALGGTVIGALGILTGAFAFRNRTGNRIRTA